MQSSPYNFVCEPYKEIDLAVYMTRKRLTYILLFVGRYIVTTVVISLNLVGVISLTGDCTKSNINFPIVPYYFVRIMKLELK